MTQYKTNATDDRFPLLVEIDGKHLLLMPDGTEIPGITLTSITQGVENSGGKFKGAHAKIELFVTLASIIP